MTANLEFAQNVDHEIAKADALLTEARSAPDARQAAHLEAEAICELLGAVLIELRQMREGGLLGKSNAKRS